MRLFRSLKLGLAAWAVALSGAVAMPLVTSSLAFAVDTTSVCDGIKVTGGGCNGGDATPITKVIKFVIELLSIIAGIAAVIMIIIAGLRYVTSGGDSSKVSGAKSAIIYALVGLVIVALSQFIVQFVLNKTK